MPSSRPDNGDNHYIYFTIDISLIQAFLEEGLIFYRLLFRHSEPGLRSLIHIDAESKKFAGARR